MSLQPIRLGLRFISVRNYGALVRALLLGSAVAVLTVLGLYAAAAPDVLAQREERANARVAVLAERNRAPNFRLAEGSHDWRARDIGFVLVTGQDGTPLPPGVPTMPEPGEVWVSPALTELAKQESSVAAYLEGLRRLGEIRPAGLLDPAELRMIRGVSPRGAQLDGALRYGVSPKSNYAATGGMAGLVGCALLVLVLAPALLLISTTTTLAAAQRRHRLAVLRLVGLDATGRKIVVAVEASVVAIAAAVLGLAAFAALRPRVTTVPFTQVGFFPSDLDLHPAAWVAVPLLVVLMTVVVAVLAAPSTQPQSVRPALHRQTARRASLTLLAIGAMGFLVLPALPHGVDVRVRLAVLTAAALAVALGLPLGLPALLQRLFAVGAARSRRPGTLVGCRWLVSDPGGAGRLVGGMCVAIFAVGLALPTVALLSGDSDRAGRAGLAAGQGLSLMVTDPAGQLSASAVRQLAGVQAVLPVVAIRRDEGAPLTGLVASCDDLAGLVREPPRGCTDNISWLTTFDFPLSEWVGQRPDSVRLPGGQRFRPPSFAQTAHADLDQRFHGALLIPPHYLPAQPLSRPDLGLLVNLDGDPHHAEMFRAQLAARAPTSSAVNWYEQWLRPSDTFADVIRWLQMGVIVALLLGVTTLSAAALGDAIARRRRSEPLIVLGASPTVRLRAHVVAVMGPMLLGGLLATAAGFLAQEVMALIDGRSQVPASTYVTIAAVVIVASALVTAITSPFAVRGLAADELRRE